MSRTAWLAARLAGYLGGWQTLLDSDCLCVCVWWLWWWGHHSVPTPGLCTWPVVRVLPPSYSLPRKKSNQGDNLLPMLKKSFQSREGSLTPTPKPTEEPSVSALHSTVEPPFFQEQSMLDTVDDCSCCRHLKEKSLFSSWVSILKESVPTDHQPTSFLSSSRSFFHPGFDHVPIWQIDSVFYFFQSDVPAAFASIGFLASNVQKERCQILLFPCYTISSGVIFMF